MGNKQIQKKAQPRKKGESDDSPEKLMAAIRAAKKAGRK